ncbi:MAG: response regulator [Verrucomicrobiota bacterium]|nr:response regulator [Verrucomicrobiota bacterium]
MGEVQVLLVDDNQDLLDVLVKLLTKEKITVVEAQDTDGALAAWARHHRAIKLLITDMILPGQFSGADLGRFLQSQKPGLRVIYMSGDPETVTNLDLDSLFLKKPLNFSTFRKIVREELGIFGE